MRRSLISLLLCAGALAAPLVVQAADAPPVLQPVPEPPPLPVGTVDADLEPEITIIQRGKDKVEEYRANGKLYMVKVTPPHGVPYYLVDEKGDGVMMRKDTVTSGTRPPMWVIKRW